MLNGAPYTNASAVNAAATIALPAISDGLAYQIDTLTFSYSAAPTGGLLTIADGATTYYQEAITSAGAGPEIVGFRLPAGRTATITLSAGGAGVVGRLNASVSQSIAAPNYGPDPDATAFLAIAGITDTVQRSAIDQLVKRLKENGTWAKYKAIYPLVGGTARSHSFNLKDPRDLDAAFRVAWSGDVEHSSAGVRGRGGTGDTFYNGPIGSMGFYTADAVNPNNGLPSVNGNHYSTAMGHGIDNNTRAVIAVVLPGSKLSIDPTADTTRADLQATGPIGFAAYSYSPSVDYFTQRDRVTASAVLPVPATPVAAGGGLSVGLLSYRKFATSFLDHSPHTFSLFFIADYLTRSELANDAIAFQAYQAALGRAVRGYGG